MKNLFCHLQLIILNFTPSKFKWSEELTHFHVSHMKNKIHVNLIWMCLLSFFFFNEKLLTYYYSALCKNNLVIQFIKTFKKFSAKNFYKKHKKFSVEWCVLKFCSLTVRHHMVRRRFCFSFRFFARRFWNQILIWLKYESVIQFWMFIFYGKKTTAPSS